MRAIASETDAGRPAVAEAPLGGNTGGDAGTGETKATGAKGRRVQLRAQRATGWTKAKRATFLDHLAATCNVRRSAAAAGIPTPNVYALKRCDPAFAALWAAALEAGYEQIETQLLARAIGANPAGLGESAGGDDPPAPDGDAFDPQLAIKVLAARGQRPGRPRGPAGNRATIEQVRATLLVKLAALNARLARDRERLAPADPVSGPVPDPVSGPVSGPAADRHEADGAAAPAPADEAPRI